VLAPDLNGLNIIVTSFFCQPRQQKLVLFSTCLSACLCLINLSSVIVLEPLVVQTCGSVVAGVIPLQTSSCFLWFLSKGFDTICDSVVKVMGSLETLSLLEIVFSLSLGLVFIVAVTVLVLFLVLHVLSWSHRCL